MSGMVKILLIEDNLAEARLLQEILRGFSLDCFDLIHVKRIAEAFNLLYQETFDVILLDLTLPDSQGLASIPPLIAIAPKIPIIVLTNTNDEDLALEAVRQGAQDYLVKRQVNIDILVRSLRYAIERKHFVESLREEKEALATELHKAQEINQLKSELVSMISHDFRNPLSAILLSAGLLEKDDPKLTQEIKLQLFRRINSASKSINRLLDEVLLVGKADSGKLDFNPELMTLEPFCRQIIEELKFSKGEKHHLVFHVMGETKEAFWDKSLLSHILLNLLDNAIKYSSQGTTINFVLIGKEEEVIFEISDFGIGIPLEEQASLFEPFHRASNAQMLPGSGLGLAMVKKCIEAHQGNISVVSELEKGTTFTVTLPLCEVIKSS